MIEINTCYDCPYLSHTGVFTINGAKPCCDHPTTVSTKGNDCFKRIIPYKNNYQHELSPHSNHFEKIIKKIPKWCPLINN